MHSGRIFIASTLLTVSVTVGFIDRSEDPYLQFLQVPQGFPEVEFPEDNTFTPERWELGRKLFYDPVLSVDSSLSCASCHLPQNAFSDKVALSPGVFDRPGVRNAPSLANVAYHPYFLREGSVPTLEMQVLVPIQEENEFAHNIIAIANAIKNDSVYHAMSFAAYNRPPDAFVITRALANFERTLLSGNSRYDQYQRGEIQLTTIELEGMEIFFSDRTSCSVCHAGFNFTDYRFASNGIYTEYKDLGRFRFTGDSLDHGLFKVPSLRNVAATAPYMHDGSMGSLEEVIANYRRGGSGYKYQDSLVRPLDLNDNEAASLIAFLHSLTDSSFLSDTRFLPETLLISKE